jgi:hypothetical protein
MSPSTRQSLSRSRRPETRIVTGVAPERRSPAEVARRFRALVEDGAKLTPAGTARNDPEALLSRRYLPRYEIALFDATYFLTDFRFNEALGFFVGYVILGERNGDRVRRIHPRIFYKDSSLVWRVASHFVHDHKEYWIGKGDVRWETIDGEEILSSVEETTNLPYEIQAAFDIASRFKRRRRDNDAIELVLREGPSSRLRPYADFVTPRTAAAAQYKVNGGRQVATFRRAGDPSSLRFVRGYEPDFGKGVLEEAVSVSKFFGGRLRKIRVLSTNREIQYQFCATPRNVWVNPPQTMTTGLSTYGVRVHDVSADEHLFIPAFEYHDPDGADDPDTLHSQIPEGYAGAPHPKDPHRADATAWIEALPIVQEFRRRVLGPKRRRPRRA